MKCCRGTITIWKIALLFLVVLTAGNVWSAGRSLTLQLKNSKGGNIENVKLYGGSYALLVGGSNYTGGWASLESVPKELAEVESVLKLRGFIVQKHLDPDHKKMSRIFENFIHKYGYDPNNRLLFYYSGHGYTRKDGRKGYLVPVDAPNPNMDEFGFISKSLSMNQILFWARDIEAKHALFLFDSCFSGTIFKHRELPAPPKHITKLTTLPVRQFITAGMAGETVPAVSTFTPAFIDGLLYNLADLNRDGYVSGTELGLYLQEKVPQHTNQTPQFGKISDYELSRGDFIFMAGEEAHSQNEPVVAKVEGKKKGELKVVSKPAGAEVFFNGRKVGLTPVQFGNIDPGSVEVTVTKPNFQSGKQVAYVNSGRKTVVDFEMLRKNANGQLTIRSRPAKVKIQFLNTKRDYYPNMNLPAGTYTLEISALGYSNEKRMVTIAAGKHTQMEVALTKIKTVSPENKVVWPTAQPTVTEQERHAAKVVKQTGGFTVYSDGIVEDSTLNLMWAEKDNGRDVTWLEADSYCKDFRGGGYSDWRMPTVKELEQLYNLFHGSSKTRSAKPPIKLTKNYLWSGQSKGAEAAFYYFDTGNQLWFNKDHSRYLRVLPVRSVQ